jgi:hypothetical protein
MGERAHWRVDCICATPLGAIRRQKVWLSSDGTSSHDAGIELANDTRNQGGFIVIQRQEGTADWPLS